MSVNGSDVLLYFSVKFKGNWDRILEALRHKEYIDPKELQQIKENMKCNYITYLDDDYPEQLKEITKPPFTLFYYGDISLIKDFNKNVSVVGAREPSEYSPKHLSNIVKDISLDFRIISGLAVGIDSLAHQACVAAKGKTVAVLGCGIDKYYPACNKELQDLIKKDHLLLSEYPEGVSPEPSNFLFRNRIVVGLSKGLIIFDCKQASGTMSSANLACNMNRDLMSIPYPVGSGYYNNTFINEGANLIETGNDVREVLRPY